MTCRTRSDLMLQWKPMTSVGISLSFPQVLWLISVLFSVAFVIFWVACFPLLFLKPESYVLNFFPSRGSNSLLLLIDIEYQQSPLR